MFLVVRVFLAPPRTNDSSNRSLISPPSAQNDFFNNKSIRTPNDSSSNKSIPAFLTLNDNKSIPESNGSSNKSIPASSKANDSSRNKSIPALTSPNYKSSPARNKSVPVAGVKSDYGSRSRAGYERSAASLYIIITLCVVIMYLCLLLHAFLH